MPAPELFRPEISEDVKVEILGYLDDIWERAYKSRSAQIDDKYVRWNKIYEGVPSEKSRTFPWPNSSNLVIQLARMYIDTFVARTLNIIFATRPLYTSRDFTREENEAIEAYINIKAHTLWRHYELTRDFLQRGSKNGTVVIKTPWVEDSVWQALKDETGQPTDTRIVTYAGPKSHCIPFEDFAVWPLEANTLEETQAIFHRRRFTLEQCKEQIEANRWRHVTFEEIQAALSKKEVQNIKQLEQKTDAGIDAYKSLQDDVEFVEVNLNYPLTNDPSKYFNIFVCFIPKSRLLLDVYYNPYPSNLGIYTDYRPFPKEDLFYGDAHCEILSQLQEEITAIHNDRRNNSYLSNAPVFKRKNGSLIPNPATSWYPGKVFDVQAMDDFEPISIGRNYTDMLAEENHSLQLAERLTGIGSVQQGYAAGMMGKRGIYNAQGTMALLHESNQRQSTNIRDVRKVLSKVASTSLTLQSHYGMDDLVLQEIPDEMKPHLSSAFQKIRTRPGRIRFDVATSDSGANAEVEKQNLMMLSQVLSQYGAMMAQIAPPLMDPKVAPGVRDLFNQILKMHQWMATRIMRALQEEETSGVIPDALRSIQLQTAGGPQGAAPQGGPGGGGGQPTEPGGSPGDEGALTEQGLQSLMEVPRLPV